MIQISILEDNDIIDINDFARPLELSQDPRSDTVLFNNPYNGSPMNFFKWLPIEHSGFDVWLGRTVKEFNSGPGVRYEFARGAIPQSHIMGNHQYPPTLSSLLNVNGKITVRKDRLVNKHELLDYLYKVLRCKRIHDYLYKCSQSNVLVHLNQFDRSKLNLTVYSENIHPIAASLSSQNHGKVYFKYSPVDPLRLLEILIKIEDLTSNLSYDKKWMLPFINRSLLILGLQNKI